MPNPSELPWPDIGVDVLVESTGHFTKRAAAQLHLDAGKVVAVLRKL